MADKKKKDQKGIKKGKSNLGLVFRDSAEKPAQPHIEPSQHMMKDHKVAFEVTDQATGGHTVIYQNGPITQEQLDYYQSGAGETISYVHKNVPGGAVLPNRLMPQQPKESKPQTPSGQTPPRRG